MSRLYYMILALLGIGSFYPFVYNHVLFGGYKTIMSLSFILVWALSLVLTKKNVFLPNPVFSKIIFVQCIFIILIGIIRETNFLGFFFISLSWIIIFLIINTISVDFFLKSLIRINIISAALCIVGIIALAFGLIRIYGVYEYQENYDIFNYGLFFIKSSDRFFDEIRPAGYYDEPGSFAFVVMFLLLINRKYFKNTTWEYLLLFLPLITTSLAHIFTMFLFGVLFYINPKNILKLTSFLILISSITYLFIYGPFGDETKSFFKKKSIIRIENVIKGEDKSRQGGIDLGPVIFEKHPWGYPREKVMMEYPDFVNETIWGPLIYYGIIGFPFYFLPFFYLMKRTFDTRDKTTFFMLVVVLANLLQRPYYTYPLFIVLLYFLFFHENAKLKKIQII